MLTQEIYETAPVAIKLSVEQAILRIVEDQNGIKDTILTALLLDEMSDDGSSIFAATVIAKAIHKLINNGQLIGVDCQTPKGDFTLVLPPLSRPMIALPIFVCDNRTRH